MRTVVKGKPDSRQLELPLCLQQSMNDVSYCVELENILKRILADGLTRQLYIDAGKLLERNL